MVDDAAPSIGDHRSLLAHERQVLAVATGELDAVRRAHRDGRTPRAHPDGRTPVSATG